MIKSEINVLEGGNLQYEVWFQGINFARFEPATGVSGYSLDDPKLNTLWRGNQTPSQYRSGARSW